MRILLSSKTSLQNFHLESFFLTLQIAYIYAKTIEDFIYTGSFLVKVVRFIAWLQESCEHNCGGIPRLPYEVENCQLQP